MHKARILAATLAAATLTIGACTDYQDEIDMLDYRVTILENLTKRLNTDIEALQTLTDALATADYVTNVTNAGDGYIITFAHHGAVLISHGSDGRDGRDGVDGQAPAIGVVQGDDGDYYWTLNGQLILVGGQPVRANGHDGRDGQDGRDGRDGRDGLDGRDGRSITPELRVNEQTGQWEISVDGGTTWIQTGTGAVGRDGRDGRDGQNGQNGRDGRDGQDGQDGRDGQDATSFFEKVEIIVSDDGEYVVFTLKNGTTFTVPLVRPA